MISAGGGHVVVNDDDPYGEGFASGGGFTVPPGYPNDSYPIRVQSGEHVQVTPAGSSSGGGEYTNALLISLPGMIRDAVRDGLLKAIA
jgi:hypothetical protein